MSLDRVQTRLTKPLANHVERVTGPNGLYPTPSHYLQYLIRQDMESEAYQIYNEILSGFQDIADGRYIEGSGDLNKDLADYERRKAKDWRE